MKKKVLLWISLLILSPACSSTGSRYGTLNPPFISNITPIKGEFKVSISSNAGSSPPSIYLNNIGNGIIMWNKSARKIKNFQPIDNEFINDVVFYKPSIAINNNGDGIIAWFSKSQTQGMIQVFTYNLYVKRIKNYLPVESSILVGAIDEFVLYSRTPIIKMNENGKGLIVWNKTIERENQKADIYSTEVDNFIPLENTNKKIELDLNSVPYIVNDNNNFIIKKFILDEPDIIYSTIRFKIDENGNGIILWRDYNKKTFLKKISNYKLDISKSIFSFDIGDYEIDLNKDGNGIIIWKEHNDISNIFYQKIENFLFVDKIFQVNNGYKQFRAFPTVDVNDLGTGLLSWLDLNSFPDKPSQQIIQARMINNYILQ